jgi:hypothetical protein
VAEVAAARVGSEIGLRREQLERLQAQLAGQPA